MISEKWLKTNSLILSFSSLFYLRDRPHLLVNFHNACHGWGRAKPKLGTIQMSHRGGRDAAA